MKRLKSKEELFLSFTREELKQLILEKDKIQSREKTAKEFGVSTHTLRVAANFLDINYHVGRPLKEYS